MMKVIIKTILFLISILALSCNQIPKALAPDAYLQWIADVNNGLSKNKKIRNVEVRARFLPTDYLAYKEWKQADSISFDSVRDSYKCGLSLQLQLQAEKSDKTYGNLMYYNISNQEEFMLRSRVLSFEAQNFVELECNGIKYEPVLSNFEGYDPLGNKLSFQIVFILPAYNCGDMKPEFKDFILKFDDPYWDLGTLNFEFKKNHISNIPKLKF